jgi:hypothetical protein
MGVAPPANAAEYCDGKHFQERTAEPQISPLRSFGAPVEMTKGRTVLPGKVVA